MSLSNLSAVVNADAEGTKIPLKFLPLVVTRHGASYYKFNAQLDHPNAVERVFLVEEYLSVHDLLEPTIVQSNSADRHTQVGLCNRYNIARRSFRNWVRKYRKEGGAGSFYDYSGRPKDFDSASTEVVINQIRDRKKYDKKDPVLKSQLNLLLVAAKKDTLARKGKKRKVEQDVTVSVNTEKRFKTAHNIRLRKPKDESHARDKAERSFRCTYKFACLLFAFAADKHAEHKWNADATTFEYKPSGANDYALILGNDADRRSEVISVTYPNGLSAFIKQVQLGNAAGETGPLVAIVAVPNLPDGTFFVERIAGFTNEMGVGSEGFLYACSSRAGNDELWDDWLQRVVVPSIVQAQEKYQLLDENGKPARSFLYTDGETIIINRVFRPTMLALFAEKRIDQAKGPPALSRPHQAMDNTPEFMGYKGGTKSVARNRIDVSNPTLRNRLELYFRNLHRNFPSCEVSTVLKDKLIEGLLTLVYLSREKYHTAESIRRGFAKCGQHVKAADPTKGESTIDVDLILSRTQAVVEPEEMDHMRAMMPQVVKEFYAHGRASDDFLDSIGVAADFHGESRDDLTLARQDAQLLTHTDTVARYKEYQMQKELAQDPVHVALMKAANEDERLLKKEAKQQVKLAEKTALVAAKAEAKAAEQLRVKGLTKQERTLEVAARKEASKLARDRKANDAAQRLEEARRRLGPEKVASLLASVQLGTKTPTLLVEPTRVERQRKDRMLKEPKHTLEVTKPSLSSLCEPLSWLTSGILDAAHNLLMQEVHAQRPDYRMHIHLCAVHSHLHRGALDIYEHQASLALVGTNLFDLDMLLFPVNHSNNHWTLIAVQPQSKTITYLDSLAPKCARSKKAIQAIEVVQQYLQHEAEYCHVQFNKKTWAVEVPGRAVPQQNNGSDCGMFVYIFARHLTLDIPLSAIRAIDMPQHRRSLATSLSTGQLSPVLQLGYAGTDVISL